MRHIVKHHTISFENAYAGIKWAFSSQPNYKIHTLFSLIAVMGAIWYKITYFEWLILILLIVIGFSIETINTAIEAATDAISQDQRPDIKIAKDVSAGAMLVFAIGAFFTACIIFLPRIFNPSAGGLTF